MKKEYAKIPKKHVCDGGSDDGMIDCYQCHAEFRKNMIKNIDYKMQKNGICNCRGNLNANNPKESDN